jgi:hypothetical protein
MGNVDRRRIENLERRFSKPTEPGRSEVSKHLKTILNELATLKSSCAVYYRGGVRMDPENIPRKILGPDYTNEDLWRLAVERTVEDGRVPVERKQGYIEWRRHVSKA